MRIAYIRAVFPRTSETFIMEEVVDLIHAGHDVVVHADRYEPRGLHAKVAEHRLFERVRYDPLPPRGLDRVIFAPAFVARLALRRRYREWFLTNTWPERDPARSLLRGLASVRNLGDLRGLVSRAMRLHNLSLALHAPRELAPDVIHIPFVYPWDIRRLVALRRAMPDVPYTVTLRARDLYHQDASVFRDPHARGVVLGAAHILTISRVNRDVITRELEAVGAGARARDITVVHSSVDARLFTPMREVAATPGLIVSVGRLVPKKGFVHLVEAMAVLRDRGVRCRLVIVGEGDERVNLERRVGELRLEDRVELRPIADQDGVRRLLAAAQVFVLPCVVHVDGDRDMLPNSLKEAMAMELPVVTSATPGIDELVHDGVDGMLVPPGSATAIADRVQALFADPALRERLGRAARQTILDGFDIAGEGAKLRAALARVVAARRPGER